MAQARLRELEARAQGRLGVHIIDTATGQEYGYRADERFMMLSSFKLLASAVVLSRVDAGKESLERRISYTKKDLVAYSPVTEKHVDGEGMTLAQLCEATLTTSDNSAANLILASYGGPAALTALARKVGDNVTRLDRIETDLNVKQAELLLDTTSPRAMARTMRKVVLGDALSARSRERLQQWMTANTTGGKRLKAGLPSDWRIGDKTGTNKTDTNDIAVIWPPNRKPWLVTAYLADSQQTNEVREATMAQVGALVRDLAS
jgi:beta-lactamase class A